MTATGQSEQQEDEEKAALRQHIQQLEDAAARGEQAGQQAAASQATDEERLEAALQQERLQARIRQLEVLQQRLALSYKHVICVPAQMQMHARLGLLCDR